MCPSVSEHHQRPCPPDGSASEHLVYFITTHPPTDPPTHPPTHPPIPIMVPSNRQSEPKGGQISPVFSSSAEGAGEGFPLEAYNKQEPGEGLGPSPGNAFADRSALAGAAAVGRGGGGTGVVGAARSAMYEAFKQARTRTQQQYGGVPRRRASITREKMDLRAVNSACHGL